LARGASAISKEVFLSAFFRSLRTNKLELQGETIDIKKQVIPEITFISEGEKEMAEI
jgi:inorganic pyrophosphatase/exopolyphosphatase